MEYREALATLLPRLHAQIMGDIPKKFGLKPGDLQRTDVPQIPINVIREALLNALVHRDYRSHQPTQIIRYSNRLEFRNGGYSLKPVENFEEPGSKPRNPTIAAVFYDLDEVETKGTGIRTMKEEMKKAGLSTPPIFESSRESNEFNLILLPHHLLDKETLEWLQQFKGEELTDAKRRALAFIREVGAMTNQDYRQLNGVDTLTASRAFAQLRDLGLLNQKGLGNGTYYVLANNVLEHEELTPHIAPLSEGLTPHIASLSEGLTPHVTPYSEDLRAQVESIKGRCKPIELKELIKNICKTRPFRLAELSNILARKPRYLRDYYLSKMIGSGELKYLYPNQPAHPLQAYLAPPVKEKE